MRRSRSSPLPARTIAHRGLVNDALSFDSARAPCARSLAWRACYGCAEAASRTPAGSTVRWMPGGVLGRVGLVQAHRHRACGAAYVFRVKLPYNRVFLSLDRQEYDSEGLGEWFFQEHRLGWRVSPLRIWVQQFRSLLLVKLIRRLWSSRGICDNRDQPSRLDAVRFGRAERGRRGDFAQ